ncbi:MAG: hypothetical protein AAFW67_12175 [Cyanobacteria bacterium J06638_38]
MSEVIFSNFLALIVVNIIYFVSLTAECQLEQSRKIVFDIADCIIPGHGKPFPNPQKPEASCAMVIKI